MFTHINIEKIKWFTRENIRKAKNMGNGKYNTKMKRCNKNIY